MDLRRGATAAVCEVLIREYDLEYSVDVVGTTDDPQVAEFVTAQDEPTRTVWAQLVAWLDSTSCARLWLWPDVSGVVCRAAPQLSALGHHTMCCGAPLHQWLHMASHPPRLGMATAHGPATCIWHWCAGRALRA